MLSHRVLYIYISVRGELEHGPSCRATDDQPTVPSAPSYGKTAQSHSSTGSDGSYAYNPHFPTLPPCVPLTYTLMMVACLPDRPTFAQIVTVLRDVDAEVSGGRYLNSEGGLQVLSSALEI
jgi:hypothetical protein